MAEDTQDTTKEGGTDDVTPTPTEFKNLQRQLEKSKSQHREATERILAGDEALSILRRVEAYTIRGDETAEAERDLSMKSHEYRAEMMRVIEDKGLTWDSDEVEAIRDIWDNDDPSTHAHALAAAKGTLQGKTVDAASIETMVNEKVSEKLREMNLSVDGGEPTTAAPGRMTRGQASNLFNHNMSTAEMREAKDSLLDNWFKDREG